MQYRFINTNINNIMMFHDKSFKSDYEMSRGLIKEYTKPESLPSVISLLLEYEKDIINHLKNFDLKNLNDEVKNIWLNLESTYESKRKLLEDQVLELSKENYNVELVYKRNQELNLQDNTKN